MDLLKYISENAKKYPAGFYPEGFALWDTWFCTYDGIVHMFYLKSGASAKPLGLGHAVSTDLLSWAELPDAILPGNAGSLDDMQHWTGCAVIKNGIMYLYYTMRSSRENGNVQRIGLAISEDFINFKKYSENPVITPDDVIYRGEKYSGEKVDCRDLYMVYDEKTDGFFGFYAARTLAENEGESSVIARVYTQDMVNFKHLQPAFAPKSFGEIEVPTVFCQNGMWYMLCLTSTHHGSRGGFSDPLVTCGTIYAVSKTLDGDFKNDFDCNTLLGGQSLSVGISMRIAELYGKNYALYTQWGTLSPPFEIMATNGLLSLLNAHTVARFTPQKCYIKPLLTHENGAAYSGDAFWDGNIYKINGKNGWFAAEICECNDNFEIAVEITLKNISDNSINSCRSAGLVLRKNRELKSASCDIIVILDANEKSLYIATPETFKKLSARSFDVKHGEKYELTLTVVKNRLLVYVREIDKKNAEILYLSAELENYGGVKALGVFAERGEAEIKVL